MRAAVAKGTSIDARADVAEPAPGLGQVLVRTIACGICGSDLHALEFPRELSRFMQGSGASCELDAGVEYVMGHGADVVLDPGDGPGFPDFAEMGIPGNPLERAASAEMGTEPPRAVIFEAVGVPGILDTVTRAAPPATRIVVVGVCMQSDRIEPAIALVKELELRFAFAYTPAEFAATLTRIAGAPEAAAPLITSTVGIDGVASAFTALRAGEQVKVIIEH